MSPTTDETTQGPGPIGICLSGGGFRAAGFHLGTLEYLYHVGLGGDIEELSTVSGGTFTGAKYALSLVEGTDFGDFFLDFYRFLGEVELVPLVLDDLTGPPPTTPSGRDNLIVSMADVYASTFLHGPDGEPWRFSAILDTDTQLKEVAFNATEFRHGLAFRFQKSANPNAPIGNRLLSIQREDAAKIRMADIVAASSAFPGGFEPLSFPYDFHWPGGEVPPGLKDQFEKDGELFPVALMDGGIYDNQGLVSLLLAEGHEPGDLGVFIISDVDQRVDDLYPFPEPSKGGPGPTLGRLVLYAYVLFVAAVGSLVVLLAGLSREWLSRGPNLLDIFQYVIPALVISSVVVGLWFARKILFDALLPRFPDLGGAAWEDLKKLRLKQAIDMVDIRLTSLFAMASEVFMKRVRSLVYGLIYRHEEYKGRRISNLIYHLAPGSEWPSTLPDSVPKWSPALRRVAGVAANMPDTLWFDDDKKFELPCLVAAGQATICFNLMKWICRNHGKDPNAYPPHLKELWERLLEDWKSMVADPYALLKLRLPDEHLSLPPEES